MAAKVTALLLPTAITIYELTQGLLGFVILLGAAMTASAVIYRALRKWTRAVEVMLATPEWQEHANERFDQIAERFDAGDKRFDQIDEHLGAIDDRFGVLAEADRLRIKDALAGDQRAPFSGRRAGDQLA